MPRHLHFSLLPMVQPLPQWLFLCSLATNQDCQENVYQEVKEVMKDYVSISYKKKNDNI